MRTKTIRQSVTFKASPHAVYEALMDSRKHARFTSAKAKISRKVNGRFTAYDGYIEGVHLDLCQTRKLCNHGAAMTGRKITFLKPPSL